MKPILAAVDNSHYSDLVMKQAVDLARLLSSDLIVLSVLNPDPMRNNTIGEANKQLRDFQHGLIQRHFPTDITKESDTPDGVLYRHERGTKIRSIVTQGNAVEKICDFALQCDASLVLVGNRGLGNIGAALLGSVSEKVVRNCQRSVLVVKTGLSESSYLETGTHRHAVKSH